MITVTINWEDLKLECDVEYTAADPSVGIEDESFDLHVVRLPNGSDFDYYLNDGAVEAIEKQAVETIKQQADDTRVESRLEKMAEGWA